jgi:PAS domain S-box-containing protein
VVACEAVLGHADLVALAGADGALRYASTSASTLLGYDIGDKLDTNILDLVHPDDLGIVVDAFSSTVATPGLREPIECRIRHADGSVRRVTVVAMNLLDVPDVAALVFAIRFVSRPQPSAIAS